MRRRWGTDRDNSERGWKVRGSGVHVARGRIDCWKSRKCARFTQQKRRRHTPALHLNYPVPALTGSTLQLLMTHFKVKAQGNC